MRENRSQKVQDLTGNIEINSFLILTCRVPHRSEGLGVDNSSDGRSKIQVDFRGPKGSYDWTRSLSP